MNLSINDIIAQYTIPQRKPDEYDSRSMKWYNDHHRLSMMLFKKYKEKFGTDDIGTIIDRLTAKILKRDMKALTEDQSKEDALTERDDQEKIIKSILCYDLSYFKKNYTYSLFYHVDNIRLLFREERWLLPEWYREKYFHLFLGPVDLPIDETF